LAALFLVVDKVFDLCSVFGYSKHIMSITRPPKNYTTLFLDMDSFFASVEQQVQPILRGKPVGVAPYTGDTGCIIAASKEAKRRGAKIGRIGEIKKVCSNIIVTESRPALYMVYHKEIKKVIESFTPYFKPLSIDEFVLHLTPREQNYYTALKLGQRLKKAIHDRVGDWLTCSIGIGPSRFLAKMAGERGKPDGLSWVKLNQLKQFYGGLDLLDITGINQRLKWHLNFFKIYSPLDFFNCSIARLRQILNHPGRLWYYRLRGYEVDNCEIKNKTIGHSHVLAPELRTRHGAEGVIRKLISKAGYRLRQQKLWASGVAISIHFFGGPSFGCGRKTGLFCDDDNFRKNIFEILKKCSWQGKPCLVSVCSFGLIRQAGEQVSIFSEVEKERALARSIDSVNDHFGADTVFVASQFLARDTAPDRIPFGQPRYEIIH